MNFVAIQGVTAKYISVLALTISSLWAVYLSVKSPLRRYVIYCTKPSSSSDIAIYLQSQFFTNRTEHHLSCLNDLSP